MSAPDDVCAVRMVGFLRCESRPGLAHACFFLAPAEGEWSEGGLRLYAERREAGRALLRTALALDRPRIGLSDGVVVARPDGDPLPSWDAWSDAALDLATMQATLAVHELAGAE